MHSTQLSPFLTVFKVGKKNDPMAVLDSKGQVYGARGLRVVDASSFPLLVPGHPQSTVCEFPYSCER